MDMPKEFYRIIERNVQATLGVAMDERDPSTYEHCSRVAGLAIELGQACALTAHELVTLGVSAAVHDVGKIGIPDSVLKKPTPFTAEDWAVMKEHAVKSQRIVLAAPLDDVEAVGLVVRHHHERLDGAGYPDGLSGEAIPVLARMVAIVDAYDAMARIRFYGTLKTHPEIMRELSRGQGHQHDAYLVGKFARLIEHSAFRA